MDYEELDSKLEHLMSDVITDMQAIHEGGVVTTLKDEDSITLGGSDLAVEMAKKSLEIAELLRRIELEEM